MNTRKSKFFTIGALFLAAALIAGVGFISGAFAAPQTASSGRIQAAPMAALPEAACTLVDTTRTCELWVLSGTLSMPDGTNVPVWGFADNAAGPALVPGPVIRAEVGETLEVILHNELAGEMVALAFPGLEVIPDMEGIASGGMTGYSFGLSQPGTYLYEAGLTPGGTRQVAMGLFGVLVVDPPGIAYDQEAILVFSEIDTAFNADPLNFSMFHFKPNYWLINGQAYPDTGYIDVAAGNTLLVRYLNAGVEHRTIGVLGLDQQIIAANGESLFAPRGAVSEPLAPGDTKEALVAVPASAETGTLYPLFNASLHQHNNNQRLSDGRAAFGGMLTFLQVSGGGAPGGAGPVVSNVTVTPAKTDGSGDVSLTANLADDDNVAAFEYFVDILGAPGTGTITPVGPASTVSVEVIFTSAELTGWSSGEHVLYLRGQDGLGNWGTPGSAALYLDKTGPAISGMSLTPNPTNGSVDVLLSATADERANGDSLVVAAEYSLDGGTSWTAMNLSASGTSVKGLTATILSADVTALGEGVHAIMVRAQDEWLNWSEPAGMVNLNADLTGPAVPAVSLNPNLLDFNQQPLPVTTVRLTATVDDGVGIVPSTLVNAEAFIDIQGAPGTGFDLYPADGLFDETVEDVYYNIPVSHFASLAPGVHQVLVVGKDQAGNWGPAGSATITIVEQGVDATGPTVTGLTASPNPTAGTRRVTLTAVATDTQSNVVSAVWFVGTDPNARTYKMSATDGRFNSLSEAITATINVGNWQPGTYQISVVAIDAAGNWGPIVTINLVVN